MFARTAQVGPVTSTDAFSIEGLRNNGKGRAVIVHADPGAGRGWRAQ
ncbi:hypothetical protein [Antrihabitans cavernicola]|nr:hypothetical protein [Spelaeibacter cavernicola]